MAGVGAVRGSQCLRRRRSAYRCPIDALLTVPVVVCPVTGRVGWAVSSVTPLVVGRSRAGALILVRLIGGVRPTGSNSDTGVITVRATDHHIKGAGAQLQIKIIYSSLASSDGGVRGPHRDPRWTGVEFRNDGDTALVRRNRPNRGGLRDHRDWARDRSSHGFVSHVRPRFYVVSQQAPVELRSQPRDDQFSDESVGAAVVSVGPPDVRFPHGARASTSRTDGSAVDRAYSPSSALSFSRHRKWFSDLRESSTDTPVQSPSTSDRRSILPIQNEFE